MSATAPGGPPRASQTAGSPPSAKDALRATVRAARAADTDRADADAARLPLLLAACAGHGAVACYASLAPEPDTSALVSALSDAGVRVLLPVLKGYRTPTWAWYEGSDALVPGWHGIPEPTGDRLGSEALGSVSFVWASALQVTPAGFRLGTGGGWYDRALLHAVPDAVVGTLVNEREVVDAVPVEPWDLPVDVVVTERRVLRTGAVRPRA